MGQKRVVVIVGCLALLVVPYYPVGIWPVPNTGSMEPAISGCDAAVYTPATDVEVGDVVIFDAQWRVGAVLHRVVDETPEGYVLQGDANARADPMVVPPERILAKIQYVGKTGSYLESVCDPAMNAARRIYDFSVGLLSSER